MSNSKPTDPSEEARIKAWRAERARIAEADKAQRIQQKQSEVSETIVSAQQDQKLAAISLLSSAGLAPDPRSNAKRQSETVTVEPTQATQKSTVFSKLSNWSLFWIVVVAPVLCTAFYLLAVATPLYEARSVIAITKSVESGNTSRAGLLGGVQGPSNLSEVFRAHSYVQSQALMDSLETELGLVTEFSSSAIDPVNRLRTVSALALSKISQFSRYVESSIDIQSGLLTLYVRAPSEAQAIAVSDAVLRNTKIQVHSLGQQVFDQRQTHAADVRLAAEGQVAKAQAALVALQIRHQEVDPRNRVESIYATIRDLEAEARKLNGEVQKAEIAGIGDSQQTRQTIALETRIRQQIQDQRAQLVAPDGASSGSLNTLLMKYELATLELNLAREAAQTALKSQSAAGQEAALNRSLFQVVVPPRTAEIAVYPKIPGTLALVLILFLALFSVIIMFRTTRT